MRKAYRRSFVGVHSKALSAMNIGFWVSDAFAGVPYVALPVCLRTPASGKIKHKIERRHVQEAAMESRARILITVKMQGLALCSCMELSLHDWIKLDVPTSCATLHNYP